MLVLVLVLVLVLDPDPAVAPAARGGDPAAVAAAAAPPLLPVREDCWKPEVADAVDDDDDDDDAAVCTRSIRCCGARDWNAIVGPGGRRVIGSSCAGSNASGGALLLRDRAACSSIGDGVAAAAHVAVH